MTFNDTYSYTLAMKVTKCFPFMVLVLTFLNSCNDTTTNPTPQEELTVRTNKTHYMLPLQATRDTVFLTMYNSTTSTVYRWYPEENIEYKMPDGTWRVWAVIDIITLYGPFKPGESHTIPVWIPDADENFFKNKIFTFIGPASFDTLYHNSNRIRIRSNEFTLSNQ